MHNSTKDQHVVPVCYLKNFSDEYERGKANPRVWVYDKLSKLTKYRTCIFVNGCLWHGRGGCKYYTIPKTNTEFWVNKEELPTAAEIS